MTDEIKLNKRQLARLREIGRCWWRHVSADKATTLRLEELGLVEVRFRRIAATGRVMDHGEAFITDAGRALLDHLK